MTGKASTRAASCGLEEQADKKATISNRLKEKIVFELFMDFADFFIGWVIDNQLGMFDQRSQLFGPRKAIAVLLAYEQVFPGELVFSALRMATIASKAARRAILTIPSRK